MVYLHDEKQVETTNLADRVQLPHSLPDEHFLRAFAQM